MTCVGTATGSCNLLAVDYDASGARIRDFYANGSSQTQRSYAGELFSYEATRGDFRIYAFGEPIAYKRKTPVSIRSTSHVVT